MKPYDAECFAFVLQLLNIIIALYRSLFRGCVVSMKKKGEKMSLLATKKLVILDGI
jgi:hypothetical protein